MSTQATASFKVAKRLERAQQQSLDAASVQSTQVCRVGDVYSAVTFYKMDISFPKSQNKWTIAKRYSEFYKLRRALALLLKQDKKRSGPTPLPIKLLEDSMAAAFPRRHLRGDNVAIIDERRQALQGFVQMLVKIMCSFPPTCKEDSSLKCLQVMLKDFLRFPDEQLHMEAKRTLAILALEDVVVASSTNVIETETTSSECCSICLGDWHEADCADMHIVKLPCAHVFHEECVMDWLGVSAECPLCRNDAAHAQPLPPPSQQLPPPAPR
ncbi:Aste57867_8700 [Aphanomyces stellatus]|uniref:Aste57867_8700 protein n=1 Tax=Aphanomyces stellatus TaxID=120398 RepID=A0A485KL12_9STRA|nr:hypothetical protein As57867_008666 [Aphanomyces stellatus]VFT85586.1 Aste57867_8700 [Aphanomyces stellatus]